MIRIVGYLVADASNAAGHGWFTIYEAPPNLTPSQALDRCAARFRTWEARLKNGSFRGITRVALEAHGESLGYEVYDGGDGHGVRVLDVKVRPS